jgi:hypothetical protein
VLLKDVEKSFTGITESLSSLRSKLESLPSGVLIIGSHTQMDSRKEKVHTVFLRKIQICAVRISCSDGIMLYLFLHAF